jgi:hypothetical protein
MKSRPRLKLIIGGKSSDSGSQADPGNLARIQQLCSTAKHAPDSGFQTDPEALAKIKRLWNVIKDLEKEKPVTDSDLNDLIDVLIRMHFNQVITLTRPEFKLAKQARGICYQARQKIKEQLRLYLEAAGEKI